MKLANKIIISMIFGVLIGVVLNQISKVDNTLLTNASSWLIDGLFDVVGQIFIASLKLLVVPLVCGSSVMGVPIFIWMKRRSKDQLIPSSIEY